jgi:hypothetical protein
MHLIGGQSIQDLFVLMIQNELEDRRRVKKLRKRVILLLALFLMLAIMPANVAAHTADAPFVTDLIAGGGNEASAVDVGDIEVWNDVDNLYVKYTTIDGWVLAETHLDVKCDLEEIPQTQPNKNGNGGGNPIPGHFMDVMEHDPAVTEYMVTVDLGDLDCEDVFIAAHAVVQKETVVAEAPYYASTVLTYSQGLRKDGTPVRTERSVPEQGLVFETGQYESNFFSLGFGGWMVAEFSCDIRNGEGNDVKIIEDTWGSYPLEEAEVYASQDGMTWILLGTADNTNSEGIHTLSEFDLCDLEWARYIKVVDTTDSAVHNNAADGYDLNAIEVLQDCVEIEDETAWGAGLEFNIDKNWATYFTYTVQGWNLVGDWVLRFVYGGTYDHDMTVTLQDADGIFEGTGGYPSGATTYSHPWTVTGHVDGNAVEFTIVYGAGAPNPGYTVWATGAIAADGTMSGTWSSSANQNGNWYSLSGAAQWTS